LTRRLNKSVTGAPDSPEDLRAAARTIRTPRAAGVAGVAFSLLLAFAMILFRLSIPSTETEPGSWLTDPDRRRALVVAAGLVPFAGIAFLWFMGVVRDRIGDLEDRFFATVFLGSGLLFVAMMFAAAAIYGALAAGIAAAWRNVAQSEVWDAERRVAAEILDAFALRMGAVFAISTSTIAFRTAMLPRWLAALGYGIALVLLVNAGGISFVNLVFPLWTFVVSVYVLLVAPDGPDAPT
jgi:hypothetical protein